MSKNLLKDAQKRRKEPESEEGAERPTEDSVRDALLDAEAADEDATKRLNAEIPAGLHERFKAACKAEGQSMTDALIQLVETYVELKGSE
jgi:TPP-dependent pyruvate/acetoin dehydrogenase alpha subunit